MQKCYAFIVLSLLLFSGRISAQMDTEHWFAPMKSNYGAKINYQAVYLSTGETNPFDVKIYSGEQLLGTVQIKKGTPAIFEIPRQNIITENDAQCMTVLPQMGLHLVGAKKYFATLRFSVPNHAEIVTSKGKAALGQEFYLGMPLVNTIGNAKSNYTASVTATENGTSVTLSGYNSLLKFTNDNTIIPSKTITLNKGESYLFETDEGTNPGLEGLIGAKLTADKPVTVSNGSFSGRVSDDGIDIFMDQSVPVEKTGQEFIIMNGNGNFPQSKVEKSLIVATEDNTQIYLNDESTPRYTIPLAGGHVLVPSNLYKELDTVNSIYALHLKTTKNVYIYEILAGSNGSNEDPSGGMNLIPVLSCFLPSKIDELSDVNYLPLTANNLGQVDYHNVKLNIVAQKGSQVQVNSSQAGLLGPFDIPGSTDWEVYAKLGVSGNQTIETKGGKAATAGIAGGSGPAGFGGYFAGFSSIPSVTKYGDCANGQTLEVDDFYDKYEWYYSTDSITWQKLPDTGYIITPGTNYGYYRATVTKLSCMPSQTTKEFKYLKCPSQSNKNFTIGACQSISAITPVFTKDSSLVIDTSKTSIIKQPTSGSAYVDASGNIHFDANNTTESQIAFTYYLEQAGVAFPEYEEVTVTVNIFQITSQDTEITECVDRSGKGYYNLKNAFETLNSNARYASFEYYTDKNFTTTSKIPDSEASSYYSQPSTTIYARIIDIYGCDNHLNPAKISLKTYDLPVISYIDVIGKNTAMISISKVSAPYFVAIKKGKLPDYVPDDSEYQGFASQPVKINLDGERGFYTAYVKTKENCLPVIAYFSVIDVNNVMTPNGDGINDYISAMELTSKINPKFLIFDRFGRKVFEGTEANSFTWYGERNTAQLPTASYWYVMQWQNFEGGTLNTLNGWILVKNR